MMTYCYNQCVEFKDWLVEQYVTWRGNAYGNERSIRDFAKYLGVSHPILSQWMSGKRTPSTGSLLKIAEKFPRVYESLGVSPPPGLHLPESLPPELRSRLTTAFKEIESAISGLDPASPEAQRIADEIMTRHGYKTTTTS
jgi:transcriptional regulator with XRE-family HTH domain